ncbi:MAG: HAD family hydrolase [Paracoccaceae bacterium]
MSTALTTIAFDADDTLWHNERFFKLTQARFTDLLADHTDATNLSDRLLAAEKKNLGHYGFGIKGFVLSMIETSIDVTDEQVPASVISELLKTGQDMLRHPIDLLPFAEEAVRDAARNHTVLLITKGDLLDQERKLAQSGLGDLFDGVEIVSNKTSDVYQRIFAPGGGPERAMMVGNSMRSDIVPVTQIGGYGVYVPHNLEWDLEKADPPQNCPRFFEIPSLESLPKLIAELG